MAFPPPFPNPLMSRIPPVQSSQPSVPPFANQKFGFFSPRTSNFPAIPGLPAGIRPRFRAPGSFVPRGSRPPNPNVVRPSGPPTTTTVFVGNISDKCSDRIVQEVIKKCGSVCNWKRLQDSSGKFKAFGFCDFMYPDGAKKALGVLKDFPLGDKRLNVKADEQTEKMLTDFAKNKSVAKMEESDDSVKAAIQKLLEEEAPELIEMSIEESQLSTKEQSKEKSPGAESTKSSAKDRKRSRSSSGSGRREKRSKKSSRKRRRHSSSSSDDSLSVSSASSRGSGRSKSNNKNKSKKSKSRRKSPDSGDSMDSEERRKLKKEIREREESYMSRLKKWEEREKRMAKHYEKEKEEEKQRQKTIQREAKKLRQFLEDYVDERDDSKYYKGTALFQRKRNYERERESDAKDRHEERKDLEEIKKSIMKEKHRVDDDDDEQEADDHKDEERMEEGKDSTPVALKLPGIEEEQQNGKAEWAAVGGHSTKAGPGSTCSTSKSEINITKIESPTQPMKKATIVTTLQQKTVMSMSTLNGVFQEEEEEVDTIHQIKKKIKPFEITQEDRIQSMTPEERKKLIKDLITRIPTDRAKLFSFNVCWEFVDETLMEQRVRPWVNKKISEYIGEEEPSLVAFICDKISNKSSADTVLQDLSMVLDDEAEVFMVKLWRLIVYESEARRLGLGGGASSQ